MVADSKTSEETVWVWVKSISLQEETMAVEGSKLVLNVHLSSFWLEQEKNKELFSSL